MITQDKQVLFCNLLKYFHRGDYSTFKKITENVYGSSEGYFNYNLFTGCLISGMLEVHETEYSLKWCVPFTDNILIKSDEPKTVITSAPINPAHPVIFDSNNNPLIWAGNLESSSDVKTNFNYFSSVIPEFNEIDEDIFAKEHFLSGSAKYYEYYNYENLAWEQFEPEGCKEIVLMRMKREFSGVSYFIFDGLTKMMSRILQTEWTFIALIHFKNLSYSKLFSISKDSVTFSRKVRLPIIIHRFLFASSKSVRLGNQIEYQGTHENVTQWLASYLTPKGSIHEH